MTPTGTTIPGSMNLGVITIKDGITFLRSPEESRYQIECHTLDTPFLPHSTGHIQLFLSPLTRQIWSHVFQSNINNFRIDILNIDWTLTSARWTWHWWKQRGESTLTRIPDLQPQHRMHISVILGTLFLGWYMGFLTPLQVMQSAYLFLWASPKQ